MASFIIVDSDAETATEQMQSGGALGGVVKNPADYGVLMEVAGFAGVRFEDFTAQYEATLRHWMRAWNDDAKELIEVMGAADFEERQTMRRESLRAVEQGSRKRFLATAIPH